MIHSADLQFEAWPQRGGGQQVGPGPQGVRVTHIPTGITVTVDCQRSQHRNKGIAMDALEAALTSPHFRL